MRNMLNFVTALVMLCGVSHASESRPNIVFLFSDDQTARAIGCEGNQDVITPHLDRLANDGVRFTNHYNTTSICMASRCSVLTGLYEYRHGCNFSHGDLERRFIEKSYPVLLRQSGYFTGFAGKIGFVLKDEKFDSFAPLFDRWAGGPGQTFYETEKNEGIANYAEQYPHCSRAYGAWAQDFLKSAKSSGKPFCMSISFKAPHLPFTPDPIDLKLYEGKSFKRPANYGVEHAKHLSPQSQTSRAATDYREWVQDYDDSAAKYYALITGVDAAVGMIREGLAREGFDRNTVIIFTSDNGYNSGSHGFGDKVLPYEEGSKSPLVIYDPRLGSEKGGKLCEAVTGNVDMAATILAFAGEAAPSMDGKSLLPLLDNPAGKIRDFLPLFNFWGIASAQSMAVVTPEWKYIYWYYAQGMKPTEELFHTGRDRYEMINLIADAAHTTTLAVMREHYDAELLAITANLARGHGYENYSTLFSRTTSWEQKAGLVRPIADQGSNGPNSEPRKSRKAKP